MKTGKCKKAMWWPSRAPAGLCLRESSGPQLHPKLRPNQCTPMGGEWACDQHGGPTLEEAKEHFIECKQCGMLFDSRVLYDVMLHEHDDSQLSLDYMKSPIGRPT